MQALTPEQTKLLTDLGWKGIEALVWSGAALGGRAVLKSIRSIRPGIVHDVIAAVEAHFDKRMKAHEQIDDSRFDVLSTQLGITFPRHTEHGD